MWIDYGADEDWGPMCFLPPKTVWGPVVDSGGPRNPK